MNLRIVAMCLVCCGVTLSKNTSAAEPSESAMSDRVDDFLAKRWQQENITPSPTASDAEFLRRAWLDLCGVIPPLNHDDGISGIRDFLTNKKPDKRERLIEALLKQPRHAAHFANLWKEVMLPADSNVRRFGGDNGFASWLRGQFADNRPYDQMVSDLLLANGAATQVGPALFYTALELKPEELAASTSRIFLGTQIQCAQCHDHPFDHWKREDFWGYAAFFAQLQRGRTGQNLTQVSDVTTGSVKIPDSDEIIEPTFLGGKESLDAQGQTRRQRLAGWLVSSENPYFAKATVNRVWALLFGQGIVAPVDDFGQHNPPSHPELLDELAKDFAATGYDLNRLLRILMHTRAYQLSSQSTEDSQAVQRPELFAIMAIKSLTADQIFDCLAEATRQREQPSNMVRGYDQNRQQFLMKFRAPTQESTEYEAGIPQALTLMNGMLIRQATDLGRSDLLVGLEAPFFSNEKRVEVLFLTTLSRYPTKEEREYFVKYVQNAGTQTKTKEALGDILWALLNSAEFVLNH